MLIAQNAQKKVRLNWVVMMSNLLDKIELIIRDICELSDRSSPEEYPDHLLVLPDELEMFISQRLAECFPNILEAATEIWCDNGMINRHEPYGVKVELLNQWMMTLDSNELMLAETELSKLSEDDLHTLCCGEETEQERIGSPFINEFLNRIFDEEYEQKAARDGNE